MNERIYLKRKRTIDIIPKEMKAMLEVESTKLGLPKSEIMRQTLLKLISKIPS